MKNPVIETVKKYNMISAGDRILCALSSGGDSVCMTYALYELSKQMGFELCCAHFMHGIRNDQAQHELGIAQRLCEKLGIRLIYEQGNTPKYAKRKKLGLEEAARELRYDFLYRAAEESECSKIATAHNQNDNAETIIFNMTRGSGGLSGIPAVRGNIIRPLIETSKSSINAFLSENKLEYATDISNFDENYSRNKIRLSVLPKLCEINSAAAENICKAAERSGVDNEYLNSLTSELLSECEGVRIPISKLIGNHRAVASRAVIAAVKELTSSVMTSENIESVLNICFSKSPSARISLPGEIIARREYGDIVFEKKEKKQKLTPVEIKSGDTAAWGDFEITLVSESGSGRVTVRSRLPGDRIFQNGMHKELKKLFIDKKIPQNIRDRIPVICNENGDILCVIFKGENTIKIIDTDMKLIYRWTKNDEQC